MKFFKKKALAVLFTVAGAGVGYIHTAVAHGYHDSPPSRGYLCQKDNSQGCQALRSSDQSEAIHTPQQNVYVGSDWKDYTHALPDGHICRANRTYDRLDLPNNYWTSTAVTPNAKGEIKVSYQFTAFHTTEHVRYYITKQATDNSKPIKWSDLVELATFTDFPYNAGARVLWDANVKLPAGMTGKHTLISMWPVSDSHGTSENFVNCSDIDIQGGGDHEQGWSVICSGVRAHQDLEPGDSATFRLFANGAVAGSVRHDISSHELGTPANWLYDLANKVNAQGIPVKIGDTLNNGMVSISAMKDSYNVYATDKSINYSYEIDVHPAEKPVGNNPPVAVIVPSTTTVDHVGWTTLDGGQSTDPDGTPADQLSYEWSVTRNADKVELSSTTGIYTQIRLTAPASEAFDVVIALKVTDPENASGETTRVLKAKPATITPPPSGDTWDQSKVYATPCQKVTYNGSEWVNGWWSQNNQPGTDGDWGTWRKVGSAHMHAACKSAK